MNKEDILRMAREAGVDDWWDSGNEQREVLQEALERFAALVAAAEREALLQALKNVTVHLIAAHSLLQRGGKKAAASDTVFAMMLEDYKKSIEIGRAAIERAHGIT